MTRIGQGKHQKAWEQATPIRYNVFASSFPRCLVVVAFVHTLWALGGTMHFVQAISYNVECLSLYQHYSCMYI